MQVRPGTLWNSFLLLLIAVVVIAAISLQNFMARKSMEWPAYVADLQSRGEPLTLAEVNALRRAADAGNTVMQLVELLAEQLESLPGRDSGKYVLIFSPDSPTLIEGIPAHFIQPTRDFLTKTAELRTQLAAMDEMPLGRLEIRAAPTRVETIAFEHIAISNASKLLEVSAVAAIWDGDTTTAVQELRRILRLAGGVHDHPGQLAFILETALCAKGNTIIEYLLHSNELDELSLAGLKESIDEAEQRATLKWMLWGERAVIVDTVADLSTGKLTKPNAKPLSPAIVAIMQNAPGKLFFQSNQLHGARMIDRLIARMNDLPSALAEARVLRQELEALPKTQILTKLLLTPPDRPIRLHMGGLALLRSTQTAIAQERFRLKYGHGAESLTDLVPEFLEAIPIDPFNNQPLIMVQSESAMIIYSVNDNLNDDGGSILSTAAPDGKGTELLDIGFRLLPPEKRGVVILDVPPPEDEE